MHPELSVDSSLSQAVETEKLDWVGLVKYNILGGLDIQVHLGIFIKVVKVAKVEDG